MAEYIEREAAKRAACDAIELYRSEYDAIGESIDKVPAADVAPVRNGRWLYHTLIDGHIHAECSECHKIRIIDNFCPNCGAKMEEEVES